jgi:hypothetical protein
VTYKESATVDGDPELQLLVERRETAFSVWRSRRVRRRGDSYWREFRRVSELVAEREEFLERQRIAAKFDPGLSLKGLWRNLKIEGIGKQSASQVTMFSPDEFNLHFSSTTASSGSTRRFDRAEVFDGFAFSCVEETDVFNTIMGIKSGAVGADGFSIKFIRIVLPHILSLLTHLFNFIITSSSFPQHGRLLSFSLSPSLTLLLAWQIFVQLVFFLCCRRGLRGFSVINLLSFLTLVVFCRDFNLDLENFTVHLRR